MSVSIMRKGFMSFGIRNLAALPAYVHGAGYDGPVDAILPFYQFYITPSTDIFDYTQLPLLSAREAPASLHLIKRCLGGNGI